MMEYGIVVFDIDLQPSAGTDPKDTINLSTLYGPYPSKIAAQDRVPFVEDEHRKRFSDRFGDGRYELKVEILPMQTAPVMSAGWL